MILGVLEALPVHPTCGLLVLELRLRLLSRSIFLSYLKITIDEGQKQIKLGAAVFYLLPLNQSSLCSTRGRFRFLPTVYARIPIFSRCDTRNFPHVRVYRILTL